MTTESLRLFVQSVRGGNSVEIMNSVWESYSSSQSSIDDFTSIFVDCCHNVISIDKLRQFKEDWDALKLASIVDRKDVQHTFSLFLNNFLNGESNGIKVSQCTDSYQSLVNQYYELSGAKESLMGTKDLILRSGRFSPKQVEAFYATEPQNFVMLICQKNIPEENLQECVGYLKDTKRRGIYKKILTLGEKQERKIQKLQFDRFLSWLMDEKNKQKGIPEESVLEFYNEIQQGLKEREQQIDLFRKLLTK